MEQQEIKRKIIATVEQTDDEELLAALYENILEFAPATPISIGQILGGVDFVELKAQVDDTKEEEMSFEQMMKNIGRWQK